MNNKAEGIETLVNYVVLFLACFILLFYALVIWNKRKLKRHIAEMVKESFGRPIDLDEDEPNYRNERYMKHLSFYTRMKESILLCKTISNY